MSPEWTETEAIAFVASTAAPLQALSRDGTILWANRACLDFLRYDAEDYIGHSFAEFLDGTDAKKQLERLVARGGVRDAFARVRAKEGAIKGVLVNCSPYIVDGELAYTRCYLRDVTASARAEERLREELDVWNVLGRTGLSLAGELDPDRLVQTITDAAVKLTGAAFGAFFYNVANEGGESYMLYKLSGVSPEAFADFPMPRNTAIFAPTFRGEGVVRYDDVRNEAAFGQNPPYHGMPPGHLPVASYLAVPIVSVSGEVHGGLFFGHPEPGMFSRRDELVVVGIAAQAATAMDNARLFHSNERAREELRQLNETLEQRIVERTEELMRSEVRFEQLVSGIVDYAIFLLDPEGHVVTWNTGAERIKGYTREEIIGQSFRVFYTEEDRNAGLPDESLRAAREHGKFEIEAWRVRKDGSKFFAHVLLDAIHDSRGTLIGFAKVTRDMTERRAIEEQLRQSQKMEAIGQLTGGVAHDFNNLLTIIIGNLDVICRESEASSRISRSADHAMRGAQRAATLTQQLLAFSRRQPLNPKPTDINRLVAGMSDLLRRTLGESIAVETVLAGGLWTAEVDPHQLESVLLNLAVNARDAMVDGGKLTIETANTYLDEMYRRDYSEIAVGQYVAICVSDTGTGMTRDVVDHAFEPFFTTKPIGQGTGLGLSQVYGFVKQSGGHVKIYSEPGEGTTVKIYLQRLLGVEAVSPPETNEPLVRGAETVLVVEDEEGVRMVSVEALRELGFNVIEASDGDAALRLLEERDDIDLLFTDVGLPGLNGRQLSDQARALRPHLRVLFTTGYARNAVVHQGRLDEGVDLLTKPYTRAQLAARVREVLDRSSKTTVRTRVALIVEDEPLLRDLAAYMLRTLGFRVVESGSVAEARGLIARREPFDLALVDIGLGDGSGLDVVALLRADFPRLPILIATGYGHSLPDASAADARMMVLAKPYSLQTMTAALASMGFDSLHPPQ